MKEIVLTQGMHAIVDDENFDCLNQFKWYAHKEGRLFYARRNSAMKNRYRNVILMHRIIVNPPHSTEIDHINGNGLDNRKENLRIVTTRQNQQNQHTKKSSNFPGVSKTSNHKKWRTFIVLNGKQRYLGQYEKETEAATVYQIACKVLLTADKVHCGDSP